MSWTTNIDIAALLRSPWCAGVINNVLFAFAAWLVIFDKFGWPYGITVYF